MTSRARLLDKVKEDQWCTHIVFTAVNAGWLAAENPAPDGSPDLWLVRGTEVIAVHVKAERAKETDGEREWTDALAPTAVEVTTWRPSDEPDVVARLTRTGDPSCASAEPGPSPEALP